jgi:hypothetical protein
VHRGGRDTKKDLRKVLKRAIKKSDMNHFPGHDYVMTDAMQIMFAMIAFVFGVFLFTSCTEKFLDGAPYTPLVHPNDFISPSGGAAADLLPVEDSHGDKYSPYA